MSETEAVVTPQQTQWNGFLENCREAASQASPLLANGHLTRIIGLVMEASGLTLPLGSSCRILPPGGSPIEAGLGGLVAPALECRSPAPLPATSAGPRAASTPMQPAASVMGLAPGTLAPDRAAVSR